MARTAANVPFFTDVKLEVKDPYDTGTFTDMGGSTEGYLISGNDSGEMKSFAEEPEPIGSGLGETTNTLVVEFLEYTAAIVALTTPGATVSSNTVTYGGRKDRRVVAIKATGTLVTGQTVILTWAKCEVHTQAEMRWNPKNTNGSAIGFRKLLDDTPGASTMVFSA